MARGAASMSGATTPWSMQDAASILARQAAHMLDAPQSGGDTAQSIARVAARLGISDRHLRRIFEIQWGISPLQYWQTRRLLTAKQLLTDTALPVAQVALLSGFSSVRRFNDAFVGQYKLQPSSLRKASSPIGGHPDAMGVRLKAAYRPPYDVHSMLEFFARRQITGIETVDLTQQTLARTLSLPHGDRLLGGWIRAHFDPAQCTVQVDCSASLVSVLPEILRRIRSLFDLDADPETINATIGKDYPGCSGLRVPGTLDGFELGVRAILGQQVTVAAAHTLAGRLAERFGTVIHTPFHGVNRLFPSPQTMATASAEALGELGIVRQRQRAIQALAQAMESGGLVLQPNVDIQSTLEALLALPGIGPWTAHYIAMRALRWPDAFPSGDVALQKALGVQGLSLIHI